MATGPDRPRSAARARILAAADRLFYAEGVRAVGVERLVAQSGVTRVTFYRHFPSKDQLIAAYLDNRFDRDNRIVEKLRESRPDEPAEVLRALAEAIAADLTAPGFRGCPFANVSAEFSDPEHVAAQFGARHWAWLRNELTDLLQQLGDPEAETKAEQLIMLRAGAMAVAGRDDPKRTAAVFRLAWNALLAARPVSSEDPA